MDQSLLLSLGLGQGGGSVDEECAVCFALYPDQNEDLETMRLELLSLDTVAPFLRDYIWHRDPFELTSSLHQPPRWSRKRVTRKVKDKKEEPEEPIHCLWGMVRFGDNIEDEWAVVALLREMSRSRPDLSIQIFDDDGDFLLIEAAYALPRWLKPEVAANRVWLRSGKLHIIPLYHQQPEGNKPWPPSPSLAQALLILKDPQAYGLALSFDDPSGSNSKAKSSHSSILAPTAVQKAISDRLGSLPGSARSQLRTSRARLPVNIAASLLSDPQLISSAVQAFFYRDADDMRAACRMTHFPLHNGTDLAVVPVLMNRCQQAQLLQQRFAAPRGLSLPQHPPFLLKASELGLKITAGFEILWSRAARLGKLPKTGEGDEAKGPAAIASELSLKQLEGLPAFKAYLASLQRSDYFQGELEGSIKYRELMQGAVRNFCSGPLLPKSMTIISDPVVRAMQGIESASKKAKEMASELTSGWLESQFKLTNQVWPGKEEEGEEEWARKQAEEVDRELKKREEELTQSQLKSKPSKNQQQKKESREEEVGKARVLDAADIVDRIGKFVSFVSGLDGAEVGRPSQPGEEGEVNLDPSKLLSNLRKVLGMAPRGHEGYDDDDEEEEEEGSSSEGSSFFSHDEDGDGDEDDDDGELDEEGEAQFERELGRQQREARAGRDEEWEAWTATDSDDDSNSKDSDALSLGGNDPDDDDGLPSGGLGSVGHGFYDVYTEELEAQLAGTHMESSFERSAGTASVSAVTGSKVDKGGKDGEKEGSSAVPLRPIDLDMNLVKNLLKSVAAQQGAAGPASNLAGLLGLDLPHFDINEL